MNIMTHSKIVENREVGQIKWHLYIRPLQPTGGASLYIGTSSEEQGWFTLCWTIYWVDYNQ